MFDWRTESKTTSVKKKATAKIKSTTNQEK